ncbi:hypothetical protein GCM10010174_24420 [Kutzneria viridogrisea]|uniref:glycine-rich domain-containing protein n=1 Tax=Kutzneria viridogrisea TaxID=47990 RepID=UPI0031F78CEC
MHIVKSGLKPGRALVSHELFTKLAKRIAADGGMGFREAESIMSEALAFLAACAVNTGEPLSPSNAVDLGWHTFILHTRDYAEFCDRVAGHFIHHVPDDEPAPSDGDSFILMNRAVQAIRAAGYTTDDALWFDDAKCTQCHGGCADDPPPNPPTVSA